MLRIIFGWKCIGKNTRRAAAASTFSLIASLDPALCVESLHSRQGRFIVYALMWSHLCTSLLAMFTRNSECACTRMVPPVFLPWCDKPAAYAFMRMHVRLGCSNAADFADQIQLEGPDYVSYMLISSKWTVCFFVLGDGDDYLAEQSTLYCAFPFTIFLFQERFSSPKKHATLWLRLQSHN